ncbi:MAG TPA: hypothetical protein VFB49_02830 [Patescibacteria group bacterium]|nr:hypothetical protein [Patescibacteria group bacterium]
MRRASGLLSVGIALFAATALAPRAYAICQVSQPVICQSTHYSDCPDAFPVAGFLGVVGFADTINSNGIGFMCIDTTGFECSLEEGTAGDGRVSIEFDWSNRDFSTDPPTSPLGCPNPEGLPGIGRNFAQIVCNDGVGAIITADYWIGLAGYDFNFPTRLDLGTGIYTLHLSPAPTGLSLVSSASSGGIDTLCIAQTGPVPVYSDCDPESLAFQAGVGCDTPTPAVAQGASLYLLIGPASPPPTDLRVAAWSLPSTTPGPEGSRCISFPTPAADECARVGSTAVVGGQDTGAVASWISTCAVPVATDRIKLDSATLSRGKLDVVFSTENETLITGFNVYADATKLNAAPIPAKGNGSNTYLFEIGRGALKSSRIIVVEALKSDGTAVRTDPINLK